jgi:hypothetical protein
VNSQTDDSLKGWDFEIDQTRLPSHLLSDLGSTSWPGRGLDLLDVVNDQNSISSLLISTDISDDVVEGLERSPKISSPELHVWFNELESEKEVGNDLLMEAIGVQRDIIPQNEQSVEARKGKKKNTGGRPMKAISYEKLLQCKGRTLEAAANEVLDVSVSTLKRHFQPLTGCKTWLEFQRSLLSDSQHVHGKERMENEDKDKVPIYVDYKGEKIPFNLSSTTKMGRLQKHIKDCLKLKVGTYDIKYFDGKHDLSIRCTSNLEYCLRHAVDGAPIVLKVVEHI